MTHRGVWYAQAKQRNAEANLATFTLRSVFHYMEHAPGIALSSVHPNIIYHITASIRSIFITNTIIHHDKRKCKTK